MNENILNIISDHLKNNPQFPKFDFYFGPCVKEFFHSYFICNSNDKVILFSHALEKEILESLNISPSNLLIAFTNDLNLPMDTFNIYNIKCKNVFHSKLYIVINNSKEIRVVIGSANLTNMAFNYNYESLCSVLIDENSDYEVKNIVYKALNSMLILDPKSGRAIIKYFPPWIDLKSVGNCSNRYSIIYIDNLRESLWKQILNFADEESFTYVCAISPIYENEGSTLTDYMKNETTLTTTVSQENFWDISHPFHPKVYLFKSTSYTLLFLGSPNNSVNSFFAVGNNIVENGIIFKIKGNFAANIPF